MKKKRKLINNIYPILLFLASLFMGMGYATINSISLDIAGTAEATSQTGIFITDVSYKSSINADYENSKIIKIYQNMLESKIILSETDNNSSITYKVTMYNSNNSDYTFDQVNYLLNSDTYSNENIEFNIEGLKRGDIIKSKESITFTITFRYKNNSLADNNILNSLLQFDFEYITNPTLLSNMIPVNYNNNAWKKVSSNSNEWHNYLDGKWANAVTYNHNLVYNKASNNTELRKFKSANDYVSLGYENYNFNKNITVVARVKLASLSSDTYCIVGNQELSGFYLAKRASNQLSFYIYGTNEYMSVHTDFLAEPDVWYTVVGTYDGNMIKLYIDGVLQKSLKYSGTIPVSEAPIVIGANPNPDGTVASTEYFNGTISDVIIMTDTLDAIEIAQNYSNEIHHNPTKHNVLYYMKFNGDNGYIHNSATYQDEGVLFDGIDDYISVGYSMHDFDNSLTVATRVKILNNNDKTQTIIGNHQSAGLTLFKTSNQKFRISIYDANKNIYQEVTSNLEVELNTWYTLVATYNGSSISLYINGTLDNSMPIVLDYKVSPTPIMIGVNPTNKSTLDNEYINGIISDVMIVDEALTSNQIQTHYSNDLKSIISDKTLINYDLRSYESREDGTIIPDEMINAMWVWIPKFNAITPTTTGEIDIEIVNPTKDGHDAFNFNNNQLKGFWIGKFENSSNAFYNNTNLNINVNSNILIKPNYNSLVNKNINYMFTKIQNITSLKEIYGFNTTNNDIVDTHLIKNNEWAALAYFTQSKYGLCRTGTCSEITPNSTSISGGNNYTTNVEQSTTQNIYGVYDTNGNINEFTTGNYNNTLNSSDGFSTLPKSMYLNTYTTTDEYLTIKAQHAMLETNTLFNNTTSDFVTQAKPWLVRTGLFSYSNSSGENNNNTGTRTILTIK